MSVGSPIVAPSILSADAARLGAEATAVERAGADWLHLDVMDGHFVPNLTFGPPMVAALRRVTGLPLDVHLMICEPQNSLEQYIDAGADRLTVHAEADPHRHRTLSRIRQLGCKPGIAINPATPLTSVEHILHLVDLVLVMSVNPGFGGQSFLPEVLPKIRALRSQRRERGLAFDIEIDGGIDPTTIKDAAAAGANVFVSGSSVFGASDYGERIAELRANARQQLGEPV